MAIAAHFDAESGLQPRAARRRLRLDTTGAMPSGSGARVLVHNVSATGMLIETGASLAIGEAITVDWPDAGGIIAQVMWSSGGFHGCQFAAPLSPAALAAAQLRADATPATPDPASQPPRPPLAAEPFGARLHRLRKDKGMTLLDVANRLGVSKPTVWAWEQGKARPTDEHFHALAAALGALPEDLRSGRDGDAISAMLNQMRTRIAMAYGIHAEQVRIMIDI